MDNLLKSLLTKELDSSEFPELNRYLSALQKDAPLMLEFLEKLKKQYLYKSSIHGLYHSEKVFFFSYILSKINRLDEIDTKIVLHAALYHDIGRENDSEDELHGLASTVQLQNHDILEDPIYKDENNFKLLCAIIDGHSKPDSYQDMAFDNQFFDVKENEQYLDRFSMLYSIMKDSDALDRARFGKRSILDEDERFLRLEESKKLIDLAHEINSLYRREIVKNYKQHVVDLSKGGKCLHSIGFDFFKILPVLQNGILSLEERNKLNLNIPSNFEGGNTDRWISVVDISAIRKSTGACEQFSKNGIGFYCYANEMIEGYQNKDRSKAMEDGYPYDKGSYTDEKYVYKRIPPECILGVIIPEEYKNKPLTGLRYIHNAMSLDTYIDMISHYDEKFKEKGIVIEMEEIYKILEKIRTLLDQYKFTTGEERRKLNFNANLSIYTAEINEIIGGCMEKYYQLEIGKPNITVCDAVEMEISKANLKTDKIQEGTYVIDNEEQEAILKISSTLS